MNTLEVLKAARELIATPEKWTRGAMARSAGGDNLGFGLDWQDAATCYCAEGALHAAAGGFYSDAFYAVSLISPGPLHHFNDAPTTTHAAVLALFDRAIAKEAANG